MKRKERRQEIVLTIILVILALLIVTPFVILVSVSLTDEKMIGLYGYGIIPRKVALDAYRYIFENPKQMFQAYKITIVFSVVAMFLTVMLTALIAYPLSRKDFPGKRAISFYLFFTMIFSGGLVPTYILITQYLHLADSIWVYIVPGLVSAWNVFMMRTFFQAIPYEISESAIMDGAGHYTIFFRFILPLSKPVLASIALFTFLGKWNDWNTSLLYINKREDLVSLQYFLQRIMNNIQVLKLMSEKGVRMDIGEIPTETVRMAMAVAVAGPALFVFPFFQKFFVKGLTVGSVKG